MKTYPQQHEPWRPDYPPVFNVTEWLDNSYADTLDVPGISGQAAYSRNIMAFAQARQEIIKMMEL